MDQGRHRTVSPNIHDPGDGRSAGVARRRPAARAARRRVGRLARWRTGCG
jgi:hypothetical protein